MRLRVMTFNLRVDTAKDRGNRWTLRKQLAIRAMQETEADVIGTQEGLPRMLDEIVSGLPGYVRLGTDRSGRGVDEHNAIFVRSERLRVIGDGTFWLSKSPSKPGSRSWFARHPRICTWCLLEDRRTGERVRIYNTHLDHFSKLAKRRGIETLLRTMHAHREREPLPAIVMGDFNAGPGSPVLDAILSRAPGRPALRADESIWDRRTYHGFEGGVPGRPIDHIFATPEWTMSCSVVTQVDQPFASDHYPVIADLTLNPSNNTCKKTGH